MKIKRIAKKPFPPPSTLFRIAINFKQWNLKHITQQDSFFSNFFSQEKSE